MDKQKTLNKVEQLIKLIDSYIGENPEARENDISPIRLLAIQIRSEIRKAN